MIQNLFSVLSQQQLDSLTKEERNLLTRLDEKLFPDYPEYVTEHSRMKSDVEKVFERRRQQAQSDAEYQIMLEASFK